MGLASRSSGPGIPCRVAPITTPGLLVARCAEQVLTSSAQVGDSSVQVENVDAELVAVRSLDPLRVRSVIAHQSSQPIPGHERERFGMVSVPTPNGTDTSRLSLSRTSESRALLRRVLQR